MENPTLDEIKTALTAKLTQQFGFCGDADSPNKAMLNFGEGEDNFVITIEDKTNEYDRD